MGRHGRARPEHLRGAGRLRPAGDLVRLGRHVVLGALRHRGRRAARPGEACAPRRPVGHAREADPERLARQHGGRGETASGRVLDAGYAIDLTPPVQPTVTASARIEITLGTTTAIAHVVWPYATDENDIDAYRVRYRPASSSRLDVGNTGHRKSLCRPQPVDGGQLCHRGPGARPRWQRERPDIPDEARPVTGDRRRHPLLGDLEDLIVDERFEWRDALCHQGRRVRDVHVHRQGRGGGGAAQLEPRQRQGVCRRGLREVDQPVHVQPAEPAHPVHPDVAGRRSPLGEARSQRTHFASPRRRRRLRGHAVGRPPLGDGRSGRSRRVSRARAGPSPRSGREARASR